MVDKVSHLTILDPKLSLLPGYCRVRNRPRSDDGRRQHPMGRVVFARLRMLKTLMGDPGQKTYFAKLMKNSKRGDLTASLKLNLL